MPEYDSPVDQVSVSFIDHSWERSWVGFDITPITSANFAATETAVAALITALRALTLCNPASSGYNINSHVYNMGAPDSAWAQRELGLQVTYRDDTTGTKHHLTIPGPDWNSLQGDGDWVDYENVLWTAFKVAFEAVAKSPAGNAVVIESGRLVGRRS